MFEELGLPQLPPEVVVARAVYFAAEIVVKVASTLSAVAHVSIKVAETVCLHEFQAHGMITQRIQATTAAIAAMAKAEATYKSVALESEKIKIEIHESIAWLRRTLMVARVGRYAACRAEMKANMREDDAFIINVKVADQKKLVCIKRNTTFRQVARMLKKAHCDMIGVSGQEVTRLRTFVRERKGSGARELCTPETFEGFLEEFIIAHCQDDDTLYLS